MSGIFTNLGFFAPSRTAILQWLVTKYEQLYGRPIDTNVGSSLYMLFRTFADKILDMYQTVEDYSRMQSIDDAVGEFLDMFARESGTNRREATKATGTLTLTGLAVGSPLGDVIAGRRFGTETGLIYVTEENVTFPHRISVVHQEDNVDSIPYPYSNVTAEKIESISAYSDGSNPYPQGSPGWIFTEDGIEWTGSPPNTPPTNGVYFVNLYTTSEVDVDVSIIAAAPGTSHNTPSNTITLNLDGLASIIAVTNRDAMEDALIEETDPSLKSRIIGSPYRDWSNEKLRKELLEIEGVRSIQIVEAEGVDQFDPDNWTSLGDTPYVELTGGKSIAQKFRSGVRVLGMSSVFLRIFSVDGLATDDMMISLYQWRGDYESTLLAGSIVTKRFQTSDLDYDRLSEYQEVRIPIPHNGLDRTLRYLIRVWMEDNAAGTWRIRYNDPTSLQTLGLFETLIPIQKESVLSSTITDPPLTPSNGDRYLLMPGVTGEWAAHVYDIATWNSEPEPGSWSYETPEDRWLTYVEDTEINMFCISGIWYDIGDNTHYVIDYSETKSLVFKTKFAGKGFTTYVSAKRGYEVEDFEDSMTDILKKFSPPCVPWSIDLATIVYINVRARLTLAAGYFLEDVADDIEEAIRSYIESLGVGSKIILSKIGSIIISNNGVINYTDLEITRSIADPLDGWVKKDIGMATYEIAELGSPGTTFTV